MVKLSELIKLETEMHRQRLEEEIPSMFNFRDENPDFERQYDFGEIRVYLKRKGYSNSEINYAFERFVEDVDQRFVDVYDMSVFLKINSKIRL